MNTAVARRSAMPKRKDAPKRNDAPVKIDAEVLRDARIVAAYREITLAEYISELLRPLIARDLEQEQARRAKVAAPRPKKTGGEKP